MFYDRYAPRHLSKKNELELAREGGVESLNAIVEHNLKFATYILKGRRAEVAELGLDLDDLAQEAAMVLIEKVRNGFDPDKNCKLLTYAGISMRRRVRHLMEMRCKRSKVFCSMDTVSEAHLEDGSARGDLDRMMDIHTALDWLYFQLRSEEVQEEIENDEILRIVVEDHIFEGVQIKDLAEKSGLNTRRLRRYRERWQAKMKKRLERSGIDLLSKGYRKPSLLQMLRNKPSASVQS